MRTVLRTANLAGPGGLPALLRQEFWGCRAVRFFVLVASGWQACTWALGAMESCLCRLLLLCVCVCVSWHTFVEASSSPGAAGAYRTHRQQQAIKRCAMCTSSFCHAQCTSFGVWGFQGCSGKVPWQCQQREWLARVQGRLWGSCGSVGWARETQLVLCNTVAGSGDWAHWVCAFTLYNPARAGVGMVQAWVWV